MKVLRLIYMVFLQAVLWLEPLSGQECRDSVSWPERYSSSFGFILESGDNGRIVISRIDSSCLAYRHGLRPGFILVGWNGLPVEQVLKKLRIGRYRKWFPGTDDRTIRLLLLTRGRPGQTAEIFVLTDTGNNRGVRVTAE